MNGEVDRSDRAMLLLMVRPTEASQAVSLNTWVDTAFTGELVIPRRMIQRLGLRQSSAVMAGLADGTQVILDTFSCRIEWFREQRSVEVVESDGAFPLLGVGLLRGRRIEIDYRSRTVLVD